VSDERGGGSQRFWCQTSLVISFGFGDYSLRLTLTEKENGVLCKSNIHIQLYSIRTVL
jgi:hypothetical protein